MPERLSNRRRKEIGKLTRRKYRRRAEQTLVEGVRAVEAAMEAGAPLVELIASEEAARSSPRVAALMQRADAQAQVPVYTVSEDVFSALSEVMAPQGLLAVVRAALRPAEALKEAPAVLVLDGVQDPGNVGTALRTAAWFGVEAVLAGPGTAGLYGPKVMRAAMGGHWSLILARTGDLADALRQFRRAGRACYGADLEGTPVHAWQPRRPSVLVLGSEAHGLSAAALDLVGERVALPGAAAAEGVSGPKGVESLNVSVAGGILMYEWLK